MILFLEASLRPCVQKMFGLPTKNPALHWLILGETVCTHSASPHYSTEFTVAVFFTPGSSCAGNTSLFSIISLCSSGAEANSSTGTLEKKGGGQWKNELEEGKRTDGWWLGGVKERHVWHAYWQRFLPAQESSPGFSGGVSAWPSCRAAWRFQNSKPRRGHTELPTCSKQEMWESKII